MNNPALEPRGLICAERMVTGKLLSLRQFHESKPRSQSYARATALIVIVSVLVVAAVISAIFCLLPVPGANAQGTGTDTFATTAGYVNLPYSRKIREHRYRWEALELGAEKAEQEGIWGKAEVLFHLAIAEARALKVEHGSETAHALHAESWSMGRAQLMLALSLAHQAHFYEQIKELTKAKDSCEQALDLLRKELSRQSKFTMLRPERELVDATVYTLTNYASALYYLDRAKDAKAAEEECGQVNASLKAEPLAQPNGTRDIDFGPYMARLQQRIDFRWAPLEEFQNTPVVVIFKIHKGGELSNLRLEEGPSSLANKTVLRAVEAAAPFDPLPAGAGDDVDIKFSFNPIVHNSTSSTNTSSTNTSGPSHAPTGMKAVPACPLPQ